MTKGKKNEPREIDRWKPDDLAFLDNRTKELSFSSPYDIEHDLERLPESLKSSQTEPGLTPLESIFREFKDEAKKILEKNGLDSQRLNDGWRTIFDPEDFSRLRHYLEDDFPSLLSPLETSMQLQMAAHVAFCVDRVRNDISNGDAEQTAVDMLKLCFTTVGANLHEIIVRGIRVKNAPKKDRLSKEKPWVLSTLEYARTNFKTNSFRDLMIYLRRNHQGTAKALKVNKRKVYLIYTTAGDYRLKCGRESISSEAFRKCFYRRKRLGS